MHAQHKWLQTNNLQYSFGIYVDRWEGDKNTQAELQIFFAVSEPSVKHDKGKACQKEHGNHNDYI